VLFFCKDKIYSDEIA